MGRSKFQYQIIPKVGKLLFIILFVYAATTKLLDFEHFNFQLSKSPFIAKDAQWLAWGIPILEYGIAILFLFPKYLLGAFYASLGLMTVFTSYILLVLHLSDDIPCACGGVISTLGWKDHIIFNMAFIALSIASILLTHKQRLDLKTSRWV